MSAKFKVNPDFEKQAQEVAIRGFSEGKKNGIFMPEPFEKLEIVFDQDPESCLMPISVPEELAGKVRTIYVLSSADKK